MKPYYHKDGITIYHGEALRTLASLDIQVDGIVTDPPYSSGGQYRGDRTGRNTTQKYQLTGTEKSYVDFSGDTRDQRGFYHWCALWLSEGLRLTKQGGVLGMFCDWRQLPIATDSIQAGGWVWRGVVPWNKTTLCRPAKGRFSAQCEYMIWGSNGGLDDERGVGCLDGLITCPVKSSEKFHLTGKPLGLMRKAIEIVVPGGTVLDPFMGSGSTLLAARDNGRRAIGIELSKEYCDTTVERLRQYVLPFPA